MRIRWRGLELPSRVLRDEAVSTDSYARFIIEPFEQGFGTTIGNSLRRVLLSSLEGAAVTSVKIAGVSHEFRSIDGVIEDVTDILLNIKGIVLKLTGAECKTMVVRRVKAGEVRAVAGMRRSTTTGRRSRNSGSFRSTPSSRRSFAFVIAPRICASASGPTMTALSWRFGPGERFALRTPW